MAGTSLLRRVVVAEQVETWVLVVLSSRSQPRMIAQVLLVDVDVVVVPAETNETNEVVSEQIDALMVSHGLSGVDGKVGTWSGPILVHQLTEHSFPYEISFKRVYTRHFRPWREFAFDFDTRRKMEQLDRRRTTDEAGPTLASKTKHIYGGGGTLTEGRFLEAGSTSDLRR